MESEYRPQVWNQGAKLTFHRYIWDPVALAAEWDGPAGRCGAFFVGFACG